MDRERRNDNGDGDEEPDFPYGRCETCDAELTGDSGEVCPTCGAHRK